MEIEKRGDRIWKKYCGKCRNHHIILVTLRSLKNTLKNISKIFDALGKSSVNIEMIS